MPVNVNIFEPNHILEATDDLIKKIADKNYDCLLGVGRGGLAYFAYVSYATGIPGSIINFQYKDPSAVSIDLRADYKQYFNISEIAAGCDMSKCKNILIIDDDCDSGYMLNSIKKYLRERYTNLENIDSAVLAFYEDAEFKPTYFYKSFKYGYSQYPWNTNNL